MRATKLAILAIAATSVSCLSEQPIAPGSPEPVDRRLLGIWRCVFPEETDPATLTITETDGRNIRAEFSGGDSEPSAWSAYAVNFEGKRFLNVQFEGDESRK